MSELEFKFTSLTPEPRALAHATFPIGPLMQLSYTAKPSKKRFTKAKSRNFSSYTRKSGFLITLTGSPNSYIQRKVEAPPTTSNPLKC